MRKKRLILNTITSLGFQILTVVCGFILPRLILNEYGSVVNGLINSIVQFLGIVGFLELGVGSVIQSALYKPLTERNEKKINEIVVSADSFFKIIARVLLIYVAILIVAYPTVIGKEFGWGYTALLIFAMSIDSFAKYYWGIVDRLLLNADQKAYIQYSVQIVTLIINTVACVVLIKNGASIQFVKLTTAIIYLARPVIIRLYIKEHYSINRKIKVTDEPIKQKWNGIAQHVAAVVLDGTDIVVLTIFSTLENVSIYSIYHMVVNGVKQLLLSVFTGFQAIMGELWARQEFDNLKQFFGRVEWLIHTGATFVFTCVGLLILQFVQVYTLEVNDTQYIKPLFAGLITVANAGHCIRLPYNMMILSAGHYKQTQSNYIVAAILNLIISIVSVFKWGLIGVAIGTLVAMTYQTIWMAIYNSKHLLKWPFRNFIRQVLTDILIVILAVFLSHFIIFNNISYLGWVLYAIKIAIMVIVVSLVINFMFYKDNMVSFIRRKIDI